MEIGIIDGQSGSGTVASCIELSHQEFAAQADTTCKMLMGEASVESPKPEPVIADASVRSPFDDEATHRWWRAPFQS
jgi:hypothetical protein